MKMFVSNISEASAIEGSPIVVKSFDDPKLRIFDYRITCLKHGDKMCVSNDSYSACLDNPRLICTFRTYLKSSDNVQFLSQDGSTWEYAMPYELAADAIVATYPCAYKHLCAALVLSHELPNHPENRRYLIGHLVEAEREGPESLRSLIRDARHLIDVSILTPTLHSLIDKVEAS